LVDVLQRISEHPNSKIEELTPRRWKELFASNPLRSALHQTVAVGNNAAG
jgi:transposase